MVWALPESSLDGGYEQDTGLSLYSFMDGDFVARVKESRRPEQLVPLPTRSLQPPESPRLADISQMFRSEWCPDHTGTTETKLLPGRVMHGTLGVQSQYCQLSPT